MDTDIRHFLLFPWSPPSGSTAGLPVNISWTTQHLARKCTGHLPFRDHRNTVHQDVIHSLRKLVGLLISGEIMDDRWIKDDHICPHPPLDNAAISQPHLLSRHGGELADGVFKAKRVFLAHVLAQDAGKCSIGAWMGMLLAERTIWCRPLRVIVNGDPRLLKSQ